ncbi:MAG: DNA polymerase III subunit gamma/tau [bacterium]|nr:DNA polymerase III subunit gamma/tau [bacterium]
MENLVLYRKYRPQTFSEIAGQEHVVRTLKNSLAQNKIAHAYLFAGPRGSGKTTIARLMAKALNCANLSRIQEVNSADKLSIRRSFSEGGSDIPCNSCPNCLSFNEGKFLDLIEIDAASNRGIDEIRSLRENVRFGPSTGKYKVYLIDEAHMITKDAFNAFLKTLEEPPAHAVFILATTEAHRLLPTIVSRTQRFDFKRLSVAELMGRLTNIAQKENVEIEVEALKLIAHEADGSARDAEGLLGQIIATGEKKITLANAEELLGLFSHRKIKDLVSLALAKDQAGALNWLHNIVNAGYDVNQLLKSLNHYVRKLIMISVSPQLTQIAKNDLAEEDFKHMAEQAKKIPAVELANWLHVFSQAKNNFNNYPLPQMALEVALINLLSSESFDGAKPGLANNSDLKISNDKVLLRQAQDPESNRGIISNQIQMSNAKKDTISSVDSKPQIPQQNSDANILNIVLSKWTEIITEVKPHNHSLSGFLLGMKPKEASSSTLTLSTKYSFHRDRLSDVKNKKIIEDAIEKVCGHKLSLSCILER